MKERKFTIALLIIILSAVLCFVGKMNGWETAGCFALIAGGYNFANVLAKKNDPR